MQQTWIERPRYQLRWQHDRIFNSRLMPSVVLSTLITFLIVYGKTDATLWFLLFFIVSFVCLMFIAWLLGEIVIGMVTLVSEWALVLRGV